MVILITTTNTNIFHFSKTFFIRKSKSSCLFSKQNAAVIIYVLLLYMARVNTEAHEVTNVLGETKL